MQTSNETARAQFVELQRRVPVLYAVVSTNVCAMACTHFWMNSIWKAVIVPGVIVFAIIVRLVWWVRVKPENLSDQMVRKTLRLLSGLGSGLGGLILVWALTLNRDPVSSLPGNAITAETHAVFFVGITFLSTIFLLAHYRLGAISVALSIVVPFTIYLIATGRLAETAIALNVLLVTGAMLSVAISFARHFERSLTDAADMRHLSAQNARLAASDSLTSLPNRRQFFSELNEIGRQGLPFAVIVVDLDGFKQINDLYGHNAGDEVLRIMADRFMAVAPAKCCLARLGGDEFGCLIAGPLVGAAPAIASDLIGLCAQPIISGSFSANIGASAGVCFSSDDVSVQPAIVYQRADYALFEAKRAGRGRVEEFNGRHEQSMLRESTIAHHLSEAKFKKELSAVFQPIVAADSHEIRAFEALVRWTSPDLGSVQPQEFIPIAERTDLIFRVTTQMVQQSLLQAATWPVEIGLKVNLSVRDLMSFDQTRALIREVVRSGVEPSRVTFEITETTLAESLDQICSNVDLIRAAGCRIAVDDFGVGYSSLNYVHALAPDVIKIDRCFITQITSSKTTKRIVRTIVELARNVGAKSVAEGVESQAEADVLAELGCDELQGYFFSKPVAPDLAAAMVAGRPASQPARDLERVIAC